MSYTTNNPSTSLSLLIDAKKELPVAVELITFPSTSVQINVVAAVRAPVETFWQVAGWRRGHPIVATTTCREADARRPGFMRSCEFAPWTLYSPPPNSFDARLKPGDLVALGTEHRTESPHLPERYRAFRLFYVYMHPEDALWLGADVKPLPSLSREAWKALDIIVHFSTHERRKRFVAEGLGTFHSSNILVTQLYMRDLARIDRAGRISYTRAGHQLARMSLFEREIAGLLKSPLTARMEYLRAMKGRPITWSKAFRILRAWRGCPEREIVKDYLFDNNWQLRSEWR